MPARVGMHICKCMQDIYILYTYHNEGRHKCGCPPEEGVVHSVDERHLCPLTIFLCMCG